MRLFFIILWLCIIIFLLIRDKNRQKVKTLFSYSLNPSYRLFQFKIWSDLPFLRFNDLRIFQLADLCTIYFVTTRTLRISVDIQLKSSSAECSRGMAMSICIIYKLLICDDLITMHVGASVSGYHMQFKINHCLYIFYINICLYIFYMYIFYKLFKTYYKLIFIFI